MTTTSAPTLPGSWTPTVSGCLQSSDYWMWMYDSDPAKSDARTVLGGPSQTTDCLAPTWQFDVVYAGTQCPPNYTPACTADAITCCPTLVFLLIFLLVIIFHSFPLSVYSLLSPT